VASFHADRLAYIDLASKQHTYLTSNIPWDIDEFDLSDNGRLVGFVANEDGFGVLHVLDTATRKEKSLRSLPESVISGVFVAQEHTATSDLICPRHGRVPTYSLDIQTGKVERWTFSETGGLNTSKFPDPPS